MKTKVQYIKLITTICIVILSNIPAFAVMMKYDIIETYELISLPKGTKLVNGSGVCHDAYHDAKYFLTPKRIDTGKYAVELIQIGDDLFQIKGTDICLETKFCKRWISPNSISIFSEKAIIIIEDSFGYYKGEVIFE